MTQEEKNLSGSLKTNNNTTTSVILSDSEESLSNNRDSSLATQVQNDEMFSGCLKPEFNPACHCEPEQSSGVAIHSMTQSLSNADRRCNDTAQSHFRQPENINENAYNA